jgi:[calcium/calmodulin-dependent protein kinase] kinase
MTTADAVAWRSVWTARESHTTSADGVEIINEYRILDLLGKGTFAEVKICEQMVNENSQPSRRFAVKILSKQALRKMKSYVRVGSSNMRAVTALDKVEEEIQIMMALQHPNVVTMFEVIQDDKSDHIWLILELMEKGPCMIYHVETKRFTSPLTGGVCPESLARDHLRDILHGVSYLHQQGICHRDIKVHMPLYI